MTAIHMDDMKRDLPGYLRRVQSGESFVILEAEKPVAELRPVPTVNLHHRPFGLCAGEFRLPEEFNDPLPEAILQQFESA